MQHLPIGSFDWKRIVKRAELPRTTKLFAEFMDLGRNMGRDSRSELE